MISTISWSLGKRPSLSLENIVSPLTFTSKKPERPVEIWGSTPYSFFRFSAKLAALGPYPQAEQCSIWILRSAAVEMAGKEKKGKIKNTISR